MELDGLPPTVMPPPVVTLTFDLLTWKLDQCVSKPRYICDLIFVKLVPIVLTILHSHGLLSHHLLWPWPLTFWPQNLISTSVNPITSVTPNWVKFPSLVFEIRCLQGFQDAQTHSQMDAPENRMPGGGGNIRVQLNQSANIWSHLSVKTTLCLKKLSHLWTLCNFVKS